MIRMRLRVAVWVWLDVGIAGTRLWPGARSERRRAQDRGLLGRPRGLARWSAAGVRGRVEEDEPGGRSRSRSRTTASGAQARAIASGFDADVAILSHEGDMELLVKAGRVKPTWKDGPYHGDDHPQLGGHRPSAGQSQGDQGLVRPGEAGRRRALSRSQDVGRSAVEHQRDLRVGLSGVARQPTRASPISSAVRDFLARVQANVVNMDQSGRQSMANFAERGTGDAVVTYENELLLHNKENEPIPYVIPPATLLIESPAAVVETAVESHGSRAVAEAFLEFLSSDAGAADRRGVRVPAGEARSRPRRAVRSRLPPKLFTMADLGGWAKLEQELYGPKGLWTSIFTAETSCASVGR